MKRINPGKPLPRKPDPKDIVRMLNRVEVDSETGCWLWQGGTDNEGYGFIKLHGQKRWVHRVSFEVFNGTIKRGMQVDHQCFCRNCINPEHLKAATHSANAARKKEAIPF